MPGGIVGRDFKTFRHATPSSVGRSGTDRNFLQKMLLYVFYYGEKKSKMTKNSNQVRRALKEVLFVPWSMVVFSFVKGIMDNLIEFFFFISIALHFSCPHRARNYRTL